MWLGDDCPKMTIAVDCDIRGLSIKFVELINKNKSTSVVALKILDV